ncbi:MAG: hypothetical protein INR66_00440 [Gordonia polyisoprenivorans]|nr:hypothetical protein [Gordonia polyisoprenivorans]
MTGATGGCIAGAIATEGPGCVAGGAAGGIGGAAVGAVGAAWDAWN